MKYYRCEKRLLFKLGEGVGVYRNCDMPKKGKRGESARNSGMAAHGFRGLRVTDNTCRSRSAVVGWQVRCSLVAFTCLSVLRRRKVKGAEIRVEL